MLFLIRIRWHLHILNLKVVDNLGCSDTKNVFNKIHFEEILNSLLILFSDYGFLIILLVQRKDL